MTDNDPVLELYNRGISAHDLRSSYVDDLVGDNHYLRLSRQEIAREKSFIKRMGSTDLFGWFMVMQIDGDADICITISVF